MGDAEELRDERIWMMDSHEQNKEKYGQRNGENEVSSLPDQLRNNLDFERKSSFV